MNDLIAANDERLRDGQAELLRGFEIDHELELRRLFDRTKSRDRQRYSASVERSRERAKRETKTWATSKSPTQEISRARPI